MRGELQWVASDRHCCIWVIFNLFFFFFPSMFLIVFSEAAGKMEMLSKNIFVSMNLC